jgi:hypothetical protein
MSKELEQAAQQLAAGNDKKAVAALWYVQAKAREDIGEAQTLLELASTIRDRQTGRLKKECEELATSAREIIWRFEGEGEVVEDAFAVLTRCRVLGGHGLSPQPGESWRLFFRPEELLLRKPGSEDVHVAYQEIVALEIGGPGAQRSGGGFIGGGFGLTGAAEGMLIGAALNMLTTRTTVNTVICLQTGAAELFLHTEEATPDDLRMRLSALFTILRRKEEGRSLPGAQAGTADPIDRLAKLAELLEKGLITEEEFAKLKTEVLS